MPSITKDQQAYCKVAQLSNVLDRMGSCDSKEAVIKKLLEINDVNLKILSYKSGKSDFFGATPLHVASYHDHIEAFNNLLKRGADFTAKNKNGDTALHLAFNRLTVTAENYMTKAGILNDDLLESTLMAHVNYGIIKNPRSADGVSHFHIACATNHFKSIEFFLDAGITVDESVNSDSTNFPGYTALHFATRFCASTAVKLLLQRGANVNIKDARGLTPVHVNMTRNFKLIQLKEDAYSADNNVCLDASTYESQQITKLLLNNLVNMEYTGVSKLHAACTLSDSLLFKNFLQDSDINCAISMDSPMWPGYTALHFAVQCNFDKVLLLLKNGADIKAEDAEKVSPLDLCMQIYDIEDLSDILSSIPAFNNTFFSDNKTQLSTIVSGMQSPSIHNVFYKSTFKHLFLPNNSPFWPGYSLSHLAVHFSKVPGFRTAKKYINLGRNILIQDVCGRTSLHLAFYQKKYKIVDLLLRHRLGKVEVIDNNGLSNLHIACARSNEAVVQALLYKGANVNIVYTGKKLSSIINEGSTPLHIAISKKSIDIIKMLLKYGANANAIDADGYTPMHQFTYLPRTDKFIKTKAVQEIGDLLFSSCDLKNVVSKTGLSHLHVASYIGNESAVEGLFKVGADANAIFWTKEKDNTACFLGYTPLHFAIEKKNKKIMELLFQAGADILHKKHDGMTLLYDVLTESTFTRYNVHISTKTILMMMLVEDKALQRRLEVDSGLTLLHIACYLRDLKLIKKLLSSSRIKVNAQVHARSPIWPKTTPLHLAIKSMHRNRNLGMAAWLLLERDADVTLIDGMGKTPIHATWDNYFGHWDQTLMRHILGYQKDFKINPVNQEGVSHFHIACFVRKHDIVANFLNNGIDVNLPVDYRNEGMSFQTPLQFMIKGMIDDEAHSNLWTINTLLKYGADVNVQDENGMTPLLKLAEKVHLSREMFFDKLIKAGADINCTNANGQNALEILLAHPHDCVTVNEIQFFIEHSNVLNAYNPVSGIGIISMIATNYQSRPKSYWHNIVRMPSLFNVDQIGRTPIHNIVASNRTILSTAEYIGYINTFIKMGYDIDTQDHKGQTALHLAAYFCNENALSGLLIAGADVNVIDINNCTVLATILHFNTRCSIDVRLLHEDNTRVRNKIVLHEITMFICGLEVNSQDLKLIKPMLSLEEYKDKYSEVLRELEMTNLIKIGKRSLTVRDFLSETGAVASRPSMTFEADRQAIEIFFNNIDIERFPFLCSVLKLQYRKTLARLPLMESATESLKNLVGIVDGFSMPELCCRMIIRFLTNTEVRNLIDSSSIDKTAC